MEAFVPQLHNISAYVSLEPLILGTIHDIYWTFMIEIQDDQSLEALCQKMIDQPFVVLDTEFIRERTYYPVLALVQVAWSGQGPVLIDPLSITEWEPLHAVLRNPDIVKVFHAGRQDLEIFYHQMNTVPVNVFDTQIAASMCGYGEQIGYGALVAKLLKIQLRKGSSYTNWLQRPLSESQLRYAREDVLYLPDVYAKLMSRARSQKRLQWISEEMEGQLHGDLFDPDPKDLWRKIKKARSLKDRDKPVLQELAVWRDQLARKINKPVRFIISDEAMLELAKVDQLNPEQLKVRRGIQGGTVERYGTAIMQHHLEGRQRSKSEWPEHSDEQERPPSSRSEALSELAWLLIKEIATASHIAPNHLIAKKELAYFIEAYCRSESLKEFPISHGWRKEMVGDLLVKLIDGQLVIRVEKQKIIWQETPA